MEDHCQIKRVLRNRERGKEKHQRGEETVHLVNGKSRRGFPEGGGGNVRLTGGGSKSIQKKKRGGAGARKGSWGRDI